jgi:two-component system sensor histidine kinase KdpD
VTSGGEPPPDTSSESDEQPASPGSRPKRGELRIYLGAAPGVGKTFAMLGEAHRRLDRGTDLVAAVVETHGRAKTAELLEGVEIIPPHYVDYRGSRFPELDVAAVLARRPQVVLVDELAHTNTPGSKNPKRWMDVEELVEAGISVISTVNVQHLESLNDVVAQITGIEQQETVPDEIVRQASQIELVDITPEALRRRLSHGNVYAPEKVDAALSNYFRRGNLTALRELALLWLADQVDAALAGPRAGGRRGHRRTRVGDPGAPGFSYRLEVQRRADDRPRGPRRRAVRNLGSADGQGAGAGSQPRCDIAHRRR